MSFISQLRLPARFPGWAKWRENKSSSHKGWGGGGGYLLSGLNSYWLTHTTYRAYRSKTPHTPLLLLLLLHTHHTEHTGPKHTILHYYYTHTHTHTPHTEHTGPKHTILHYYYTHTHTHHIQSIQVQNTPYSTTTTHTHTHTTQSIQVQNTPYSTTTHTHTHTHTHSWVNTLCCVTWDRLCVIRISLLLLKIRTITIVLSLTDNYQNTMPLRWYIGNSPWKNWGTWGPWQYDNHALYHKYITVLLYCTMNHSVLLAVTTTYLKVNCFVVLWWSMNMAFLMSVLKIEQNQNPSTYT